MKKTNIYALALIVLCFLACKEKKIQETIKTESLKVKVITANEEPYNEIINCSGRITLEEELKLSFKTGGVIRRMNVREGQKVKKGDVLTELDLSEIEARAKQAFMAFEKAERDFKRVKNLYHDSVATLEQFQDVKTTLDYAKSNYDIARFNLTYSIITAPSDGTVLKKLAEENEIVGAGYPVILFGSNEKSWVVKTSVTDNQVVKLNLGDPAKTYSDAYPDTFFQSTVTEISSFADPYTGVFDVKLQLTPVNFRFVSGLIVKNTIITRNTKLVIPLPYESLVNANGNYADVYIVKNKLPVLKRVTIFKILDEKVLVSQGISEGDMVITENVSYIKKGDSIQITE